MKKIVLLVEDNPKFRKLVAELIKEQGFRVLEAESKAEALEIIETTHPDVVLLDIQLPDGCGLDLVDPLKKIDHPQVVALTSYKEYENDARAKGVDKFVWKEDLFNFIFTIMMETCRLQRAPA